MSDLTGRAAIVTGAASVVGRAIAGRLVGAGATVLAVDLRPDPWGPGEPYPADLTTRKGNRLAVTEALERFGRLDIIVANAGVQYVSRMDEFSEDRWDAMLAVMLTSPFLLARYGWPHLAASGEGRFVAIASVHGLVASPFEAADVSAKHGLLGLVKTLSLEGAGVGISAVAVCPGHVRTPLVERDVADQARVHGVPEHQVLQEMILAPHAVKELIEPADVAELVALLVGPHGGAFTGAPVVMDQGWTAR